MATEVPRDDRNILTKGGKDQIGICGFVRENANGGNKDKSYLGCPNIVEIAEKPNVIAA